MNVDIAIIGGAGHIGLPLGVLFANKGKKVILYDKDKKNVFRIANQIRKDIEEKQINFENTSINVTVSMGIASSEETKVFQEILDIADKRLYKAKNSGRNKVIMD
mgnify:CR=1 FL=1